MIHYLLRRPLHSIYLELIYITMYLLVLICENFLFAYKTSLGIELQKFA